LRRRKPTGTLALNGLEIERAQPEPAASLRGDLTLLCEVLSGRRRW